MTQSAAADDVTLNALLPLLYQHTWITVSLQVWWPVHLYSCCTDQICKLYMLVTVAAMLRKKSKQSAWQLNTKCHCHKKILCGRLYKTSMYLYADPVLVQRASLEQQQLEQVTALAVLHDQGLVCLVLKDPIQLC